MIETSLSNFADCTSMFKYRVENAFDVEAFSHKHRGNVWGFTLEKCGALVQMAFLVVHRGLLLAIKTFARPI